MSTELDSANQALVDHVTQRFTAAERLQRRYRDRWNTYYQLYRSFQDWRENSDGLPRDVDRGMADLETQFGAHLVIPIVFSTIETVLPRMLSQSPRMLVLPREQSAEQSVANMKALIDSQQDQIDYELVLQDVGKDGLTYGLGVQKVYWRTDRATRTTLVPGTYTGFLPQTREVTVFDDPVAESVDPFDFFWDPYGWDIASCGYVLHRTWRTTDYVLDHLSTGDWANTPLTAEDVRSSGSAQRYDEVWASRIQANRMAISGRGGDQIHEVWEFHDRKQVVTILDRQWPVRVTPNPAWHGDLPFQVYRPTRVNKQMVGIGEPEQLEHLSRELSTLRSQRRDAATIALNRPFAFYDGLVDPADMKFGPGIGIPVNGDPRELLFPLPVGDVPNSSYQEEQAIQGDIDRTSGISDATAGAEGSSAGASATATGAQLVAAAASVRIQNKTKLLEKEVIRNAARQFLALNQQRITADRTIPIPLPPAPGEADRRWAWRKVGPQELSGEMEVIPEGGSTAPDNVPQMRQDAQLMWQMLAGNQQVDQRVLLERTLKNLGVETPQSWLVPPDPKLPVTVLQTIEQSLVQAGMDQGQAHQMLSQAAQQALSTDPASPDQAGQAPPPPGPTPPGQQGAQQQGPPQQDSSQRHGPPSHAYPNSAGPAEAAKTGAR